MNGVRSAAMRVLVVEDHADMRAWFVEELREGFRVIAAADGRPASTITFGPPEARATVGEGDPVLVPWTV